MKLSNTLLGILNVITALISLPIIGAGIWLAIKHHSECARLLQWPAIALGLFILVVSLAGIFGSFCRKKVLLGLYMTVVFLLILAVIAFTVFAVIVTNKGAGHAVSGKGFYEYRLGDYSTWLQRNVVDKPAYWSKIKSCLVHSKVCKSLEDNQDIKSAATFYKQSLSPIQACRYGVEDRSPAKISLEVGKALHLDAQRKGYTSDFLVGNTIISMYGGFPGAIDEAEGMFKALLQRSTISWNAMHSAYANKGEVEKALDLYKQMKNEGVSLIDLSFIADLQVCLDVGSLHICAWIHFDVFSSTSSQQAMVNRPPSPPQ